MTNLQMRKHINKTAKLARKEYLASFEVKPVDTDDLIISINWGLPYVGVNTTDKKYFFQGEEASNLLEEGVKTGNKFQVSVEDAIIWMAQGW